MHGARTLTRGFTSGERAIQIMDAFCKKKGIDKGNARFIFDGQRLNGAQTPRDLDMEVRSSVAQLTSPPTLHVIPLCCRSLVRNTASPTWCSPTHAKHADLLISGVLLLQDDDTIEVMMEQIGGQ